MSRFEPFDWYREPTSYDIIFDADSATEADFLEAVHEKYVLSKGNQVLEPACGTGRLLAALAVRGYTVGGFDCSRPMLAYARRRFRERGISAVLKCRDFADFSFGERKFDLAFCLVNSFRHILSEWAARRHLSLVADALQPGGVYAIGLELADYSDPEPSVERWVEERDGMRVDCKIKQWPPHRKWRINKMRSRIRVKESRRVKRFESTWFARAYSPREFKSLVKAEPRLELVGCHTFDYDIETTSPLGGKRLDKVVILRRAP